MGEDNNNNTVDAQPSVDFDLDLMADSYDQLKSILYKQISGDLTDSDRTIFANQDRTMEILAFYLLEPILKLILISIQKK
ncbi:MAG: hypothetical protein COA45_05950 [Zetaproteobacteria bacterium]|nr:MAG: hypothetical protein COA45_05950 [Zetaproteobacteria bacterium]